VAWKTALADASASVGEVAGVDAGLDDAGQLGLQVGDVLAHRPAGGRAARHLGALDRQVLDTVASKWNRASDHEAVYVGLDP
jgi:hypothetical protein